MIITADLDYETSEQAGAGGTFQVVALWDEDENELTEHVDQGHHYASTLELEKDLAVALGTPVELHVV